VRAWSWNEFITNIDASGTTQSLADSSMSAASRQAMLNTNPLVHQRYDKWLTGWLVGWLVAITVHVIHAVMLDRVNLFAADRWL
jgi:hypothetical protein